ncbi:BA75_02371T0 [Komagataella pastoris]|uniref:BA75_02371T0 n=1 Tax=Komagataella pastoris TaxID=4922 RepID=A0A1B2JCA0_PICPA|nr:BA75_02371T0 [Komagataella pastoris]
MLTFLFKSQRNESQEGVFGVFLMVNRYSTTTQSSLYLHFVSLPKTVNLVHCNSCIKIPQYLSQKLAPAGFQYRGNEKVSTEQLKPWKQICGDRRVISPLPKFNFNFALNSNASPKPTVPIHASFVKSTDPMARRSSQLKGVVSSLNKLFKSKPIYVYSCGYFCLRFYSKYQYTGLIRKTKPGILLKTYGHNYNSSKAHNLPVSSFTRTVNPFEYAIHRRRTRSIYKKLFFDTFLGRDGLYEFTIFKVPLQKDIAYLKDRIYRCLNEVNDLDEENLMSVGQKEIKSINKGVVNKQCKMLGLPILLR